LSWTPIQEEAFLTLKDTLSSPATLHVIHPTKPIVLHSDWSTQAISGWISQKADDNDQIHPLAFESRKLQPAERNYSPYDGELLALVHCLKIFRPYLLDREIILHSDQKALHWLLTQRTLTRCQQRWLDEFQAYDLTIEWIPGSQNTIADILSHR